MKSLHAPRIDGEMKIDAEFCKRIERAERDGLRDVLYTRLVWSLKP